MSNLIPKSWAITKIKNLADFLSGFAFKSKDYSNSGIPILRMGNIQKDYTLDFNKKKQPYIPNERIDEFKRFMLCAGDIVITLTDLSSTGQYLGTVARVPENQIALLNQRVSKINIYEGLLDNFFFYSLQDPRFRRYMETNTTGTLQKNTNHTYIGQYQYFLPPLNEQRRIVAKIEELNDRASKARTELEAAREMVGQFRQSVLAAAFRGDLTADWRAAHPDVEPAAVLLERIRAERRRKWEEVELAKLIAKGKPPKDDKWKGKYKEPELPKDVDLVESPESWIKTKWENIGICQNGRAFPSKYYQDSGIKLLRPGNLHMSGKLKWTESNTRYLDEEWLDKYPSYLIQAGDLVINLTAQSLADNFLGRICIAEDKEKCLLNQRIARISTFIVESTFILWLFKAKPFRDFVDTLNTGSLIQHMFTSQIDQFIFALPPLKEQKEIVKRIEAAFDRADKIEAEINTSLEDLKTLDQAILAKAFRGELVPQDPNDEPASELLKRIEAARAAAQPQKKKTTRRKRKKA